MALTLNSDVIFSDEEPTPCAPSPSSRNSAYNLSQGFEDTIELYERAIQGAKQHGFTQYEALGKSPPTTPFIYFTNFPLFFFFY